MVDKAFRDVRVASQSQGDSILPVRDNEDLVEGRVHSEERGQDPLEGAHSLDKYRGEGLIMVGDLIIKHIDTGFDRHGTLPATCRHHPLSR